MKIRQWNNPFSLCMLCVAMTVFSQNGHALPFSIVPKAGTLLPTQIVSGQSIRAFYTVTNNTGSVRSSNYIKYLPLNVTQITSDSGFSDLCGTTFTLQSHGVSGDSCTLELSVTGPVDGSNPDSHHHLFACFPGGLTCAGTPNPLNVSLVNAPGPHVAVGGGNLGINALPYIATSNAEGAAWSSQSLTLPSGSASGVLLGASCVGSTCVGVGAYSDVNGNSVPAAVRSTDGGVSWSQQVFTPPTNFTVGEFDSVSCLDNTCTASGGYFTSGSTEQFAIANSSDSGNTWSQQTLPLLSPYLQGELYGISCSGSSCVAVGSYADNMSNYAALAYSSNSGSTWSQVVLPLLSGIEGESLTGVSCIGLFCLAVGEYSTVSQQLPGVAVSRDGGSTWTQATLALPNSYSDGVLNGVSCTQDYCVAVGNYNFPGGSNAPTYPAIAVTTDGGNTWSQQVLTFLPAGFTSGIFYSVDCTGSVCVAAGTYQTTDFVSTAGIAFSVDSGHTWSQQVLSNPSGIMSAILTGVS